MSNSNNYQCRVCFRKYRDCGSGCVPWEASGFGSPQCYYEWSQGEIERLKRERDEARKLMRRYRYLIDINERRALLAYYPWIEENE